MRTRFLLAARFLAAVSRAAVSLAAVSLVGAPPARAAALEVVATLPELALLTEAVGGERVAVTALARGDEDPHTLAAKPSHSRRLLKADLVVYNGLQLEVGWLPLLLQGARSPALLAGGKGNLDLGASIEPLEVPTGGVDRSQGDVHPEGNPHYTVDPGLYPLLADAIAERLAQLDPAGAGEYRARAAAFRADWEPRLAAWQARLAPAAGKALVTYHKQWEYFAARFGLRIVDYIEDRPGIPPTPRHVGELVDRIKAGGVALIVYADLTHPEVPEKLAARSGCKALALPQSPGSRGGTETLVTWFDTMIGTLAGALPGTER